MKIQEKKCPPGTLIENLADGVVFRWEEGLYVRTRRVPGAIAVGVDGKAGYLVAASARDRVVAYPDAVLILEPEDGQ